MSRTSGTVALTCVLATATAAQAQQASGNPGETELRYSVAVESFSTIERALRMQRNWTAPDSPVFVSPTKVDGEVYYRVYVGLFTEPAEAAALADRLFAAGFKTERTGWDTRPALHAFDFGLFATQKEAGARIRSLTFQGIPAYWVPALAVDGTPAYRVYAGGYERPGESAPLAQKIADSGLESRLGLRLGLTEPLPDGAVYAVASQPEPAPPPEPAPEPEPLPPQETDEFVESEPPMLSMVESGPIPLPGFRRRSVALGFKGGTIAPGCIRFENGSCAESDASYSVEGFMDLRFSSRLIGSFALALHGISAKSTAADTQDLVELTGSLKWRLVGTPQSVALRPGIGIGYGSSDLGVEHLLTGRAMLELLFPSSAGVTWLAEIAAFTAAGDRDKRTLDLGPGLMARAGLIF